MCIGRYLMKLFFEKLKVDVPNSGIISMDTLTLSGEWLGVDPKTNTKQTCGAWRLDYVLRSY